MNPIFSNFPSFLPVLCSFSLCFLAFCSRSISALSSLILFLMTALWFWLTPIAWKKRTVINVHLLLKFPVQSYAG